MFGDQIYHQKTGTAMGTKFAPHYACLAIGLLEETILFPTLLPLRFTQTQCDHIIKNIVRYMDDVFITWPTDIETMFSLHGPQTSRRCFHYMAHRHRDDVFITWPTDIETMFSLHGPQTSRRCFHYMAHRHRDDVFITWPTDIETMFSLHGPQTSRRCLHYMAHRHRDDVFITWPTDIETLHDMAHIHRDDVFITCNPQTSRRCLHSWHRHRTMFSLTWPKHRRIHDIDLDVFITWPTDITMSSLHGPQHRDDVFITWPTDIETMFSLHGPPTSMQKASPKLNFEVELERQKHLMTEYM